MFEIARQFYFVGLQITSPFPTRLEFWIVFVYEKPIVISALPFQKIYVY